MDIKATDVKALRDKTGAGMMDCKNALVEANGNMAEAEKILKEKGLAAMAKRADRATAEGRIFVRNVENKIYVIELTCETDFVSNGADFVALGEKLLDVTIENGLTAVEQVHKDLLTEFTIKTRENMSVNSVNVYEIPENGVGSTYVHSDHKTGAVVLIKGSNADVVKQFAYDCCLHIAAFTPAYASQKEVPEAYIAEQTEIFKVQMDQDEKMASKPQNVKDGILQGKIKKHLAEICFEDQMFVKDDKKSVTAKMAEIGKEAGANLEFVTTKLFVLGK